MRYRSPWTLVIAGTVSFCLPLFAGVLPEDRADALYHSYEGGGLTVNGPSLLARTHIGQSVSVFGNYYVDSITSATIDVVTQASPYHEERTEYTVGGDYLHGKSLMSLAYTNSEESDYLANAVSFDISQDMFGDLTTVSLGYMRNWNVVGMSTDSNFEQDADSQRYRVGITQVLTKDLIAALSVEAVTDEGYLNNPYRSVRYVDPSSSIGYSWIGEVYPNTRTSNATALRARYFLPWRGAVHGEYRMYQDSWGIDASNWELGYTQIWKDRWTFDVKYRYYEQTSADFYSDLFSSPDAQNFMGRDKELSTFNDRTIGLGVSYEFPEGGWGFIERGSLNFSYERIAFDYKNFRDLRDRGAYPVGDEPLYNFTADVVQLYLSLWY